MADTAPRRSMPESLRKELDVLHAEIEVLKENQKILTQILMEMISRSPE